MLACNLAVYRLSADARTQFVQAATLALEGLGMRGEKVRVEGWVGGGRVSRGGGDDIENRG